MGPSAAEQLLRSEVSLLKAHHEQMSPGCPEDLEDIDRLVLEHLVLSGSRDEGLGLSFSPAWALAFYGEDCFSPEVFQYAANLGQHKGSPCLAVKTQVGEPEGCEQRVIPLHCV